MAKAMELLRKLRFDRAEKPEVETAFDRRLKKLGVARQAKASRAVLFRTQPAQMEA